MGTLCVFVTLREIFLPLSDKGTLLLGIMFHPMRLRLFNFVVLLIQCFAGARLFGGTAVSAEVCTDVFSDGRRFPCSTTFEVATASVYDWHPSSPPLAVCKDGLLNAVENILGLPKGSWKGIFPGNGTASSGASGAGNARVPHRMLSDAENQADPVGQPRCGPGGSSCGRSQSTFPFQSQKGKGEDYGTASCGAAEAENGGKLSDARQCSRAASLERESRLTDDERDRAVLWPSGSYGDSSLTPAKPAAETAVVRRSLAGVESSDDLEKMDGSTYSTFVTLLGSVPVPWLSSILTPKGTGLLSTGCFKKIISRLVGGIRAVWMASWFHVPNGIMLSAVSVNPFKAACEGLAVSALDPQMGKGLQCLVLDVIFTMLGCPSNLSAAAVVGICDQEKTMGQQPVALPLTCAVKSSANPKVVEHLNTSEPFMLALEPLNVSPSHPLPANLPEDLILREHLSHFFLFRATQETIKISRRRGLCEQTQEPIRDLVPGWRVELVVALREEGQSGVFPGKHTETKLPYLFASRPRTSSKCDVLVALRPTTNMFEWKMDFSTNMIPFLHVAHDPPLLAHSGFARIAEAVSGPLTAYLVSLFNDCPHHLNVTLAGHSLGSGVGQVLSLMLRSQFPVTRVSISTAFYAVPNVFNKEAATMYGQTINGRSINFEYDPVPYTPCTTDILATGWPRCSAARRSKRQAVVDTGEGVDFYARSPGVYTIRGSSLLRSVVNTEYWFKYTVFGGISVNKDVFHNTHVDAYTEWASYGCTTPPQSP